MSKLSLTSVLIYTEDLFVRYAKSNMEEYDAFRSSSRFRRRVVHDSDSAGDSEADDAADMVIASDAVLQLMPATRGVSYNND